MPDLIALNLGPDPPRPADLPLTCSETAIDLFDASGMLDMAVEVTVELVLSLLGCL